MDAERAHQAIGLVDLTDLTPDCTDDDIDALCERARRWGTAAVCIWPDFVRRAASVLSDAPVRVATVVNFPSGAERPFAVGLVTERALADGADEIDVVLPYRDFVAGRLDRASAMLDRVRAATADRAVMKVILETGEIVDLDLVERASLFAIEHGADFIKSSSGKTPVSATLPAIETMLRVIADTDRPVGIKPSGGISTADDAAGYLDAAEQVMGKGFVSPATFRFGASGLLNALLAVTGEQPAPATATSY